MENLKITLKGNPLLNLSNLSYAQSIEGEIIDPETRQLTQKFNINKHELILVNAKPLSSFKVKASVEAGFPTEPLTENDARRLLLLKFILKGKRVYFSRLFMKENSFEFLPPQQLSFEIEKPESAERSYRKKLQKINERFRKKQKAVVLSKIHLRKISGFLAEMNREAMKNLLTSAKRDFDFISHFNSEMFHHNLTAKGLNFCKETVIGIYEEEKYTKIIDLSDPRERMGFISLYAIAFHGLSLSNLYSVDGIFTLQENREEDDKKRRAGQEVFELVFGENREGILTAALKMAAALKKLPLPEVSISLTSFIKKNFTLYCGIGDIGRAFSRLILNDEKSLESGIKTAKRLSYYRVLEKYYHELETGKKDLDKSEIYKNVTAFAAAVEGKKTAGELNFTVK
jgi:hypothetical protein